MRALLHLSLAVLLTLSLWTSAFAQEEEDKGFLTRTLQDVLSSAGRTVSIDGFAGALSSAASFDRMTIADDDGVWLTLEGASLVWNRAALLRGRLEVESLTATRLDIPRLPVTDDTALPEAEAAPFSLPNLPVSVQIDTFSIAEITLGAPVMGEAAQLTVTAAAQLTDELANIDLTAERTDAKSGIFALKGNFDRETTALELLLSLAEGPEGIAARLLNLPDQPDVDLRVEGNGPLDSFAADVRVATQGQPRLAGQVTLAAADTDRLITADIGGDITALLAPRYRDFFGTDVALTADARLPAAGGIDLRAFALRAEAARIVGRLALNAENWPTLIDITGEIAHPDGTPILLPLGGAATQVQAADLEIAYDAENGSAIEASFDLSQLVRPDLSLASTQLTLQGTLAGDADSIGAFAGDVSFDAQGLDLADSALTAAVGSRLTGNATIAYDDGQPIEINALNLSGPDYALTGDTVIEGLETGLRATLDAALTAQDLSRFAALAGQDLRGSTRLALQGNVVPLSGQFDLTAQGETQDLALGIPQADAVLTGRTQLRFAAARDAAGTRLEDLVLQNAALNLTGGADLRTDNSRASARFRLNDVSLVVPQYSGPVLVLAEATQDAIGWQVDASTLGPYEAALTAKGRVTGPDVALRFTADITEMSPFAEGIEGPVKAQGVLTQFDDGWRIETAASGPFASQAQLKGIVAPALNLDFDLSLPDVQPVAPQVSGPLSAKGNLRQTEAGFVIRTSANGPYASAARVEGLATGPDMNLTFNLSLPDVNPLAPAVSGPFSASGLVRQTPDGIALTTTANGPYRSEASVDGVVTGPSANIRFDVAMPDIGALVDKVNGPLRLTGNARRAGSAWALDTSVDGPAGTNATLAGTVQQDGALGLDIAGSAPLGLAGPFIAPRDLQGQARFDLAVNGPPALSSVSGTIATEGATFNAPNLRLTLQNIAASINLARNRATLALSGAASEGGTLRAEGAVTLTPSYPADLQIALQDLILTDPRLFRTWINGALRVAGPLTGGAAISGEINLGETTVNIPSTGITSIGAIPDITHIGAGSKAAATRRKAGLDSAASDDDAAGASGPGFGLNLRLNAPNRIFVRGRGLDAELGGALALSGNTNRVISSGAFDLLRGRLDILGQRFDLTEGTVQFLGDLLPYLRFVTTTATDTGEARIIVQGPADAPEVTFEATPEAPQDEVLAQILFGRQISEISPFQALQLANAVATLAGGSGVNIISNLRSGFGLDDLDVTTTESGATAVRAGKYISENVYTDITAASDGTGEVSLNLDITSNLKGKATLESDGNSGVGIFFEKDY